MIASFVESTIVSALAQGGKGGPRSQWSSFTLAGIQKYPE